MEVSTWHELGTLPERRWTGRADNPDDLQGALEQALARDTPALLKVKVGEFPTLWEHVVLPRVRG